MGTAGQDAGGFRQDGAGGERWARTPRLQYPMPIENGRRLTDSDIHELLRQYKITHSTEVRDRIVVQYTNLVESIARRFAGAAEPAEDLVQEGFIGLITAVDGYNADKGVKFSTYATHFVIGQIKHYLRDKGKIIKEPAWLQELNQRMTRVIESLSQELGRMPTNAEIGKLMGLPEENVTDLLTTREVFKVASLDGGGEQDDDSPASYDIDRVKADKAVDVQLPVEDKLVLGTAMLKLKELEQAVVHEFYYRGRNQTEIARSLGISCNYVSHILRNSTKKLRKILVTDELKETQREVTLAQKRSDDAGRSAEISVVDGLTRLYNRAYFDNRLEEEVIRGSRHEFPVAIALVKLDGCRHMARAYGTIRSDETLQKAASLIRSSVRRVDIVTRFDAETFGLILPHTGQAVDVVHDRLASLLGDWIASDELDAGRAPISLKIGSAYWPGGVDDAVDLMAAALESLAPVLHEELPLAA